MPIAEVDREGSRGPRGPDLRRRTRGQEPRRRRALPGAARRGRQGELSDRRGRPWPRVAELGAEILQKVAKDLLVAAYMAFGMYRARGLQRPRRRLRRGRPAARAHWDGDVPPARPPQGPRHRPALAARARPAGVASYTPTAADRVGDLLPHRLPLAPRPRPREARRPRPPASRSGPTCSRACARPSRPRRPRPHLRPQQRPHPYLSPRTSSPSPPNPRPPPPPPRRPSRRNPPTTRAPSPPPG
jgi:hypothetical protein